MKCLTISLLLFSWGPPANGDDAGKANKLFIEAVQFLKSADKATSDDERSRLSEGATANLNKIVERYPSTDLTVKLVSDATT